MTLLRTKAGPKTENHLQVKFRRPRPGAALRASQRKRNARQHATRAIIHRN